MKSENSDLLKSFKGFLITDDTIKPKVQYDYPVYHLSEISASFEYIPSLGCTLTRKRLVRKLDHSGGTAINFISSKALIGINVKIGKGVIVNPRSSISSDAIIGNYVLINCNTGIGHDVVIGDNCSILGSVTVNGSVKIGTDCLIGTGAGSHPKKNVGSESIIGMGAIVFNNVRSGSTVIGNPAKRLKSLC